MRGVGRALLPQRPDHTTKAGKHYEEEAAVDKENHSQNKCYLSVHCACEKFLKKGNKASKLVRSPKRSTANVRKSRLEQSFPTFTSSQNEGQGDTPHHGRDSDSVLRLPQSQVQHRCDHSQVAFNTHTGHQQGTANQVEHTEGISYCIQQSCNLLVLPSSCWKTCCVDKSRVSSFESVIIIESKWP